MTSPGLTLAYSTWGMQSVPIDVAVAHCAQLGFDGLELAVIPGWPTDAALLTSSDRQRIRKLYDDHELELSGMSGNVQLMANTPYERNMAMQQFRSYLDLASELQKPNESMIVTTTSGGKSDDWDNVKHEIAERLGELAEYAKQRGVRVGIEPHVSVALRLPEQVLWLLEQVDNDALGIHFDISHFNVQGIPMETSIAALGSICSHTHIKDERGVEPDFEFLIPGEGEMNYPRYLRLMDEAGYRGPIVVEISLMVQKRPDYDPLAAATQSYQVLNEALTSAGIVRAQ